MPRMLNRHLYRARQIVFSLLIDCLCFPSLPLSPSAIMDGCVIVHAGRRGFAFSARRCNRNDRSDGCGSPRIVSVVGSNGVDDEIVVLDERNKGNHMNTRNARASRSRKEENFRGSHLPADDLRGGGQRLYRWKWSGILCDDRIAGTEQTSSGTFPPEAHKSGIIPDRKPRRTEPGRPSTKKNPPPMCKTSLWRHLNECYGTIRSPTPYRPGLQPQGC